MAMNMWMTISMCVVVVMAATALGSTPLQEQGLSLDERRNPGCCPWEFYDCLIQRTVWRSRLHTCYSQASMICTRGRVGGCCPGFLRCFEECTSRDRAVCYYRCKFARC